MEQDRPAANLAASRLFILVPAAMMMDVNTPCTKY